jgi:hypothetical protein
VSAGQKASVPFFVIRWHDLPHPQSLMLVAAKSRPGAIPRHFCILSGHVQFARCHGLDRDRKWLDGTDRTILSLLVIVQSIVIV